MAIEHDNNPTVAITYPYTDAGGRTLYEVLRRPGKKFVQRRPNRDQPGEWHWNLDGIARVPYRLPNLEHTCDQAGIVFVVEGEKDADRLTELGATATTSAGGTSWPWPPDWAQHFHGCTRVYVLADNDHVGRQAANQRATVIATTVPDVRRIDLPNLPDKGDVSDWLDQGNTLDQLYQLCEYTPPLNATAPEPAQPSRWPDLDDFLAIQEEPYDWLIEGLLERRDRLILTAHEGGGKSTLIRQLAVQIASGIHPFNLTPIPATTCLLIDCENSEKQVRRKLRPLRDTAGPHYQPGHLRIRIVGDEINLTQPTTETALAEVITHYQPGLILIGPLYKLIFADPKDEPPARALAGAFDRLRAICGSALIIEAHSPYADGKTKRLTRPYGASLWSRWPEFGIYLAPDGRLEHWRGPREERTWPTALERSQPWPWAAATTPPETPSYDGPTRCMEAIVAYLTDITPSERSASQLCVDLRARGASYRDSTIRVAAEQAATRGTLTAREGPRSSRLYSCPKDHEEPDEEMF